MHNVTKEQLFGWTREIELADARRLHRHHPHHRLHHSPPSLPPPPSDPPPPPPRPSFHLHPPYHLLDLRQVEHAQGVVGYFDVRFCGHATAPATECVELTTSPHAPPTHWGQARAASTPPHPRVPWDALPRPATLRLRSPHAPPAHFRSPHAAPGHLTPSSSSCYPAASRGCCSTLSPRAPRCASCALSCGSNPPPGAPRRASRAAHEAQTPCRTPCRGGARRASRAAGAATTTSTSPCGTRRAAHPPRPHSPPITLP